MAGMGGGGGSLHQGHQREMCCSLGVEKMMSPYPPYGALVHPTPSIPHPANDELTPAFHVTIFTPREVTKMLAACGLSAAVFILESCWA